MERLEFNRFREIIMYLCNQSSEHTHTQKKKKKKIAYFKNSAFKKIKKKSEFYQFSAKSLPFSKKQMLKNVHIFEVISEKV